MTSKSSLILASLVAALLANTHLRADFVTGQDITITSTLNGGPSQSATVVDNNDGSEIDASTLGFSWMIPGDYISFSKVGADDAFALELSGNSNFSATDVLDLSFTLPSGLTFDVPTGALVIAYGYPSASLSGGTLTFNLPRLDTISDLIDNLNTKVEVVAKVDTVPDASSTATLLAGSAVLVLAAVELTKQRGKLAAR